LKNFYPGWNGKMANWVLNFGAGAYKTSGLGQNEVKILNYGFTKFNRTLMTLWDVDEPIANKNFNDDNVAY